MGKRALVLLNPKARLGRADMNEAFDRLRSGGIETVVEPVDGPGSFGQIIPRFRDRVDAIIVGGGDGTFNAAAEALLAARLPLGVLPLGTANDLARTLGIPSDLLAACDVIAAGHQLRIDVGQVNDKFFFNAASLGLSVKITHRLKRENKSRWGVLAYLFAAAQVLVRARPFQANISADGRTCLVKTVQIAVGNGKHYGGGMTIHEDARIDDGRLRLYSLEVKRWWQLLPLLPALRRGTLTGTEHVRTLEGTEFEVRPLRKRRHVNTDGELTTHTPAKFRVLPKALAVFVPQRAPLQ